MTKEKKSGIIKATSLPSRDLLYLGKGDESFAVGWPAFGPGTYPDNLAEARKTYSHSAEIPVMTFEEPTTADSIRVVARDPAIIKKTSLEEKSLQLGRYASFKDGLYFNPPKDADGNPIVDERILKRYLNGVAPIKVDGGKIYVVPNSEKLMDFAFAERETLRKGIVQLINGVVQTSKEFSRSGLARALDHTTGEKSKNLGKISSAKYYYNRVRAVGFGFDPDHILRVAGLSFEGDFDGNWLSVNGDYDGDGYVFGKLVSKKMEEGISGK